MLGEQRLELVGGKGANLGALTRMDGVSVPPGFCVTTDAYRRVVLPVLSLPDVDDLRGTIEGIAIPDDLAAEIADALGPGAYAVRSSATAEDLPGASFAGQQDSYLNIEGTAAILAHVSRCWASLFTERAVAYRRHHGIDDRTVRMAVIVQQMVPAEAAGVLFTADPVTGDRKVAAVEAVPGLGEDLVSGRANPDLFTLRDGKVVAKTIARDRPTLTDDQAVRLGALGRRIELHFGRPQDIEWCLAGDEFAIVQSRPITTLFPVPEPRDQENHVYVSVGHQQMWTEPMMPLGLSVRRLNMPPSTVEAGGRLFVDVAAVLASPARRAGLLAMWKSDPLVGDALRIIAERDFVPSVADGSPGVSPPAPPAPLPTDPAIPAELIAQSEASVAALKEAIRGRSGADLVDFVLADMQELKRLLFDPRNHQAIMAGMEATWWLNDHLEQWLGEKNAADVLTRSVPHNITSEMGLELLDVADAFRPYPSLLALSSSLSSPAGLRLLLDELPRKAGAALRAWLDRHGMRCVGEIDITRPRWSEQPETLLPLILGNIRNFEAGANRRLFEEGRAAARAAEDGFLARLRELPDGEAKATEVAAMIDRLRTFAGYREYPKYFMMRRYFIWKLALLDEADRLVRDGVLPDRTDIFYLTLPELGEVTRTQLADLGLIDRRREEFRSYEALTPPRVYTSDGEVITGSYRRDDVPAGALVGLPVSTGTVEGRARVLLDMAETDLEPGDILVTPHTDPSWTPVFVTVAGLVTEVGGQMTHGAVIAREYGLPAVVGVPNATHLIPDGAQIRVHGTDGYIEIL
ncbi:putative phosphoenolpyruvate synthase [Paractinoplanes tereljensis]|uniref:Phosphoenolpyruvate synthase n=1 Tax=Paractinoplanes tereljensis TaxID=571912 RepID=A0A919NMT3_9ACTN|nr:putative phosphoenolpyruvate synthase [Actinoplanes tereljensis]